MLTPVKMTTMQYKSNDVRELTKGGADDLLNRPMFSSCSQKMDANKDGVISLDEFLETCRNVSSF